MNAIALAKMKMDLISVLDKEHGKTLDLFTILAILEIVNRAIDAQGLDGSG